MKKQKISCLILIIIVSLIFASCTNENTSLDETDIVTDDYVSTQIHDLLIMTPEGQEPIQNDDDTILLPGGGIYNNSAGDKITVSPGTIIRNDGSVQGGDYNIDKTITIESPDGEIIVIKNDEMYINGVPFDEYLAKEMAGIWNDSDSDLMEDTWNKPDPDLEVGTTDEGTREHKLADGTVITINNGYPVFSIYQNDRNGYIIYNSSKCTIEFSNGVKIINAPINTRADIKENITTITIGDGDAVITYTDGTEKAISNGTVLTNEGNIVE